MLRPQIPGPSSEEACSRSKSTAPRIDANLEEPGLEHDKRYRRHAGSVAAQSLPEPDPRDQRREQNSIPPIRSAHCLLKRPTGRSCWADEPAGCYCGCRSDAASHETASHESCSMAIGKLYTRFNGIWALRPALDAIRVPECQKPQSVPLNLSNLDPLLHGSTNTQS
jgi:hypothetical protein